MSATQLEWRSNRHTYMHVEWLPYLWHCKYQDFGFDTPEHLSCPIKMAWTGLGTWLASNCLYDIIICDAVLRIMSLILSSHAWLILMLWYIISSQLVTLGLLLHNAHIRQHYHAVYICRDGGGRLFVYVYVIHPWTVNSMFNFFSA